MVNVPTQPYLNPNTWGFTIGVIVMVCLVPFGDYYSMDSPGAMEYYVKESMTGFTKDKNGTAQKLNQDEYGNLYAIYSFPNIFLCIVGGYILDSVLGRRKGTFVFAAIVTLGQLLVTIAAKYNSIIMMYCGRFLFGIGAESLALGEYAYNTYWFDRTKVSKNSPYQPKIGLSTAFGIAISITRGATFFAFNTLGPIYESVAGKDDAATDAQQNNAWKSWNNECNGSNQTDVCPVSITVVDCEAGYTKETVPFDTQYNVDSNATAVAFFTAFALAAFSLPSS
jgi:MFS family permease